MAQTSSGSRTSIPTIAAIGLLAGAAACTGGAASNSNALEGGVVAGPEDDHCSAGDAGLALQSVNPASCTSGGSGGPPTMEEEADPRFNGRGYDDDCKYRASLTVTPVSQNRDVTFTLTLTNASDGTPVKEAEPEIEAFLTDTHPAPNTGPRSTEANDGVYTVGPIRFDQPGDWIVRFHLFEACDDSAEDSPHGHIAFHINVP